MIPDLRIRIAGIAEDTPDRLALLGCDRRPASYKDLLNQIEETVSRLTLMGVGRADRIAVVMPNGPEMASLFLGIASVCTCAPLNPAYTASEFEFYLSDLKPRLVIVDAAMESSLRGVARLMDIEIVELHRQEMGEAGLFELKLGRSRAISDRPIEYTTARDVALVLHTSGTTSRPKIVPLTHENLYVSAINIAHSLALTPDDTCLNIMPLFHVHGLVGAVLSSLSAGASVVCTPGYNATKFFAWLAEFQPTWYTGVPAMHHSILTRAEANQDAIASHPLRFIRSSSAALPPKLMEQLEDAFGVPVLEAYGMTEAAHQMSCNGLPPRTRKPGSVGRPEGTEIAIMNEAGALLPEGEEGEIVIRGPNVMAGYDNNPDANLKSFTEGWFRTGDQGRFDGDGDLFLTARIKELIVRGGEKIPPREIDEALLQHPAVEQAVGFAVPDAALGERVAAAVVLKPGALATELELCEHAAGLLASFKVPEKIFFVAEIPKGPTGKLQRIGLAEKLGLNGLAEPPMASTPEYCAPRNETEARLEEMWRLVLKLERAGIHDNFFQSGGDSILASQLIARIRQTFGVELSSPRLFQFATIAELAQFIDGKSNEKVGNLNLHSVSRKGSVQLTSAQQRMWFLSRLEPESPVYNRPLAYRLTGSLDLFRLQRSLNAVVERHEILRTSYCERNGVGKGVVRDASTVSICLEDLSGQPAAQRESATAEWLRQRFARPFNLQADIPLRCWLARVAPDEHILLLVLHHIAFDASTEPVILGDLGHAYNGTLPSAPCAQYADYAAWQYSRETLAREEELAWWKQQLADMEEPSAIPGDFAKPVRDDHKGSSVPLQMDAAKFDQCKALARAANTTVFTVLLACFDALLHRYTGSEDIAVGTPVAVRNHPAAESMAGLFINTLALRTSASGDPTFREFLGRVRDTVNGALDHREVPFDAVVNAVRQGRGIARPELFQVMFEYRNIDKPRLAMEGIETERIDFDREVTPTTFDLTIDIEPCESGMRGTLDFNTNVFERSTIERMARHFETLLSHAIQSPGERISQLRLSSAEERAQLLAWGQQAKSYPGGCLHTLFEEQVERTPDNVALVCEDRRLTYRELNARANQLANYLRRLSVGPDMLVGLYTERSLDTVVGLIGILKAGGAYLPIDTAYPKDRIGFMLEDAQVRVLVTQEPLRGSIAETEIRVVCLDAEWGTIARESPDNPVSSIGPESLAYVIYTSGSTGKPKGCLVTHKNVSRLMQATEPWFHFNDSDVWTLFHSHAFDFSVWEIWGALHYGGRLVVVPYGVSRSPEQFHQLVREQRVTVLNQTPSAFRQFIKADERVQDKGLALRLLILGGEALDMETLRPWFDKHGDKLPRLINMYGITESTVHVTYRPISFADVREHRGSVIGCPIPDVSLYILDSQFRLASIGEPGEIYVGGAGVARGYLNRPELTRERFVDNPFSKQPGDRLYRSGDLARRLANGDIEYLGRIDHQVKIRGFRIELGEIETALRQHPYIRDAAVVLDKREEDKRLAAYVVPGTSTPSTAELRSFLGRMLPDYMLPSVFVVLEKLPLTAHGKLDRRALPAPTLENIATTAEYVAPRTPLERDLAAIWQESLELERVGIDENFFDIGGHSLSAMRVVVRIRSVLDLDVPVACLFQNPTIELLAMAVDGMRFSMHGDEEILRLLEEIETMQASNAEGN